MINILFPRNEHTIDRAIRVILGIALLSLVVIGPKTMWGLLGLIPLITGLVGSCPLYRIFKINTAEMQKPQDAEPT